MANEEFGNITIGEKPAITTGTADKGKLRIFVQKR